MMKLILQLITFLFVLTACTNSVAGPSRSFSINTGSGSAADLTYTPAASSNWNSVPTTVTGGLDTLATSGVVKSQLTNLVLSSPNGSSGVPSFRSLVLADIPALQATKQLYVDGGRSDTYTADGTVLRPYKTIQAAINVALSGTYDIIVGPGTYTENLTFNNASMNAIRLVGHNSTINPASGSAIDSSSNNGSLTILIFDNFTILKPINLTGSSGFCGATCFIMNSSVQGSTITINTPNEVDFERTFITSNITATNTGTVAFREGPGSGGTLTLVNSTALAENWLIVGATSIDATSTFSVRRGTYVAGAVTANGVFAARTSFIAGAITVNNGGTFTNNDSSWSSTLTINSGGTFTNGGVGSFTKGLLGASAVTATNAVLVTKDGNVKSTQTTAPVPTVNANAGTGATCTVSNATDVAGKINLTTTATSPAAGAQCSIAFNKTYNVAPICVVSNADTNSATQAVANGEYFTTSTTALVVNYTNADAAGHANVWMYHCIETQ